MTLFRHLALLLTLTVSVPTVAYTFSSSQDDIPPASEAMVVSAFAEPDEQKIRVLIALWPEVYLYQHSLGLRLLDTNGNLLNDFSDWQPPAGKPKVDEIFGNVEVYYDELEFTVHLDSIPLVATILEVDHQGCLEDILCYTPQTARIPLTFVPEVSASISASGSGGFVATLRSDNVNAFSDWMSSQGLARVLLLFFVGGLLLAFTPCVFPMIPILSGIIAGAGNPSASKGFFLSSAYVLGVAIPYTVAGLLVALFGASMNLQYMLQQPSAIIISTAVFVILALAMFGLYELQLPASLRNRLNMLGDGRRGGSLWGAGLLGAISALVVSPCVTPILAGALVYVAASGDAATGALSLFALSIGMGVPLIIAGTGGGHLLPRAGAWMEDVTRFFGVVMLGVAIWLLDRIVNDSLTLALYGLLLATYGIWLGALEPVKVGESRLKRSLALIMALYGAIMVVGAAGGGTDPWQPLERPNVMTIDTGVDQPAQGSAWTTIIGSEALQQQLDQARRDGQPVLIDFYADWCVACKVLEEKTLNQPDVLAAMATNNYRLIKADITAINRDNQGIMQRFGIIGLPCLIFLDSNGNEVDGSRILGEMGPESFISHLNTKVSASNRL
ncbi:MAG: thiol:disulfide interchange protein [Gammaproteobacteria bacterium HGW-Gammaproteobacteria-14]|nr:MAG: thiol:disulfide interchange protein [Gammaproteobacteria bacterium HGW-Gammaproteobacteria-14]